MNRQIFKITKNYKSESTKFIRSIFLKRKRQNEKDVAVETIQGLFKTLIVSRNRPLSFFLVDFNTPTTLNLIPFKGASNCPEFTKIFIFYSYRTHTLFFQNMPCNNGA